MRSKLLSHDSPGHYAQNPLEQVVQPELPVVTQTPLLCWQHCPLRQLTPVHAAVQTTGLEVQQNPAELHDCPLGQLRH